MQNAWTRLGLIGKLYTLLMTGDFDNVTMTSSLDHDKCEEDVNSMAPTMTHVAKEYLAVSSNTTPGRRPTRWGMDT